MVVNVCNPSNLESGARELLQIQRLVWDTQNSRQSWTTRQDPVQTNKQEHWGWDNVLYTIQGVRTGATEKTQNPSSALWRRLYSQAVWRRQRRTKELAWGHGAGACKGSAVIQAWASFSLVKWIRASRNIVVGKPRLRESSKHIEQEGKVHSSIFLSPKDEIFRFQETKSFMVLVFKLF